MKIYLGADHAGFELKEKIKKNLETLGFSVEDKGATEYQPEDDYPDFVIPVAKEVSSNPNALGIIIGGSGQGEAICANRFKNVRAVVFNSQFKGNKEETMREVRLSKEHNNSNIISLGARFIDDTDAIDAIKVWLETPFSGDERHTRRLQKIDNI